ncbi:MAG: ABC transporter ATP-binding protein [Candidatus Marinimicrobia bacterium]|nr:ABC transporter ATP-binding protein [Candidatus Neomarinimicrobiota bacterium]
MDLYYITQKANLSDLKKALFILSDEKSNLFLFAFLFLITASLEMLSIASIGAVISKIVSTISDSLDSGSISNNMLLIIVASIFALRGVMIIFLSYKLWHYCVTFGATLRTRLMKNYQAMSYERFTRIDPGQYSQRILEVCAQFSNTFLWSILRLCADIVILAAISFYLIYINSTLFFLAFGAASILFLISEYFIKPKIKKYGEISNNHSAKMTSTVHNGINGLREIKLLKAEKYFSNLVKKYALTYAHANVRAATAQVAIKTILESVIIVISIIYVILYSVQSGVSSDILLDLGIFVFGASRAIPAINQIVLGLNKIRYCSNSINVLYDEFNQNYSLSNNKPNNNTMLSEDDGRCNSISLKNVSSAYANSDEKVLLDINLDIKIGKLTGIFGESGSGKSTLINILSGLINPIHGEVLLLDKEKNNYTFSNDRVYICPQESFMIDDTLSKNVALSDIYDENKVKKALELSGFDFTHKSKKNLNTIVGVGGKQLSGGQRQRVCVARAIYHDKDFLLFDEPTSSLDKHTANIMLSNLKNLSHNKSILIVSHDKILLEKYCDEIFELKNNTLQQVK